jgi:hypothetical protein
MYGNEGIRKEHLGFDTLTPKHYEHCINNKYECG